MLTMLDVPKRQIEVLVFDEHGLYRDRYIESVKLPHMPTKSDVANARRRLVSTLRLTGYYAGGAMLVVDTAQMPDLGSPMVISRIFDAQTTTPLVAPHRGRVD